MSKAALVVVIQLAVLAGTAVAQEERARLRVGTRESPPFAMRTESGEWAGIAIQLWRDLARELDVRYEFEERSLEDLFNGLEDGSLDASVGALTLTSRREERVDFTHTFYETGLGIAVTAHAERGLDTALRGLVSPEFLSALGLLLLLLFGVGLLIWVFERRKNREQFGGTAPKGLGAGFWWSAVTMTTVGYGDKAPITIGGRVLGLIWMFASVIVISFFTATIASSLTVSRLEPLVHGPEDLPTVRVGSVPGTTSAGYLESRRLAFVPYGSTAAALDALAAGDVEAVVYDRPILRYEIARRYPGKLTVLDGHFVPQAYALAVPEDSPLRERVNRILIDRLQQDAWKDLVFRYVGE